MEKKTVKQLKVIAKEKGNIPNQLQRPIPAPRTNIPNQPQRPIPTPRTNIPNQLQRPIPTPRTNISNQPQRPNILDEPVPEINFPPLEPYKTPRQFLDEPVPEINFPILKPSKPTSQPTSLKHLVSRVAKPLKKEINKFADWIVSYVPEPIKKTVNKRVESLKEKVNRIFNRFTPKERQTAFKGYLKTFRIDGVEGYDYKKFNIKIKPKVLDLIKKKKETYQG